MIPETFSTWFRGLKFFSNKHVQEIALSVVQWNGHFAQPENVLIAMLGDKKR